MKVGKHVVLGPKVQEKEIYKLLRRLQKDHEDDRDYTKIVTKFIVKIGDGNNLLSLQEFINNYYEEKK